MGFIDFPTLVLIIIGSLLVGVHGITGVDVLHNYLGSTAGTVAEIAIGASGLWQFSRQRF